MTGLVTFTGSKVYMCGFLLSCINFSLETADLTRQAEVYIFECRVCLYLRAIYYANPSNIEPTGIALLSIKNISAH